MSHFQDAATLTIDEQHLEILRTCDALLSALRSGGPVEQVGSVRMKLAGLLHANLLLEETQLNGPIRRLPVAGRPQQFSEMGEEVAELRRRYSAHVGQWSLAAIERDRAGYAYAAQDLVGQLKGHLDKKRRLLPLWRRAISPNS